MKFVYTLGLILVFTFCLSSLEFTEIDNEFEVTGDFWVEEILTKEFSSESFSKIVVSGCENKKIGNYLDLPVYTKLVSLPAEGNYEVLSSNYSFDIIELENSIIPFDVEKDDEITASFYSQNRWIPEDLVTVSKPVIMRGNRFTQIAITPVQYNPVENKLRIHKNIDHKFKLNKNDNRNPLLRDIKTSNMHKLLDNKVQGLINPASSGIGQYLFIAPSSCSSILQPLMRWKEKLGYKTKLAALSEIGNSAQDIQNYLQYAYDNWEQPPEFVVLVGDVSGNIQCPSNYVEGYLHPWCVTDHSYTLLDGDDYFADIFIGRLSVQTNMELMTVISKIIKYEREPYLHVDWFDSGLMVGFVNDWNGYSQRETLLEIRDKLLDFEFAKVDTFIAPWQYGYSLLRNEINTGHSLLCYRGTGSADSWGGVIGPMFMLNNIPELNNGYMLPMIHSMTCGGGDFASEQFATCFGEKWLSAGSPSVPKGAIGFIGPSEYDTKTWFNNTNAMGIYQGITQEGLFKCGEMLLRGKMELYDNYPNGHGWGGATDSDQFYFYVYNLLGDPGLSVWTDTPKEVNFSFEDTLSTVDNFVEININLPSSDKSDFRIALTNSDSLIAFGLTDDNGILTIPIDLTQGSYSITASKYGYLPLTKNLTIQENSILNLEELAYSDELISGTNCNLNFTLGNLGIENFAEISIFPTSTNNYLTFLDDPLMLPHLSIGDDISHSFSMNISDKWDNERPVDVFLNVTSSDKEFEFLLRSELISPELFISEFSVNNSSNSLIQKEICNIEIDLNNIGDNNTEAFTAELSCMNEKAEVLQSTAVYGNIPINKSLTGTYQIKPENVISGETASFQLQISNSTTLLDTIFFEVPIGLIDSTSVTFGDYGYYAIESDDEGNFVAPEYDWIEIDPEYGGQGIELIPDHSTVDGYIGTINLPFQFRYFGNFYHDISICSEGYAAFGNTENIFHRNKNIPSGSGVSAMLAPFWDDLENGKIFTYFDQSEHKFIIEWSEWNNVYDTNAIETFQIILFDEEHYSTATNDGEILFQYKEIENIDQEDNYSTIGIENKSQNEGLVLTFSNIYNPTSHIIKDETAILFTLTEGNSIPFLSCDPKEISVSILQDSTLRSEFYITNSNENKMQLDYDINISHFSLGKSSRNIENDQIIYTSGNYVPIQPYNLLFYILHNSPDNEAVAGVTLDFPEGFHINGATDLENLEYNGETGNGIEVTWGYDGTTTFTGSTQPFEVYVTIEESLVSPVNINWQIDGDESGSPPHFVNGSITINPSTDKYFWIRYPNGGEILVPGTPDSLIWDSYGTVDSVKISISRDVGASWNIIEENAQNSGNYHYDVLGPLSDDCKFKVSTLDDNFFDVSDSTFQISALNIQYPNSESILLYNQKDTIRWQNLGGIDKIDLEISTDNKSTWNLLAENIDNNGFFEFIVPGPPADECYIRISASNDIQRTSERFEIIDSPVIWLSTNITSGCLEAGEQQKIDLYFTTEDMELGTYSAVIQISSSLGQIINLPVTLEIYESIDQIEQVKLFQNYPNPFYPSFSSKSLGTTIKYELPEQTNVEMNIFNVKGQHVISLLDDNYPKGEYIEIWDGKDKHGRKARSGVYIYQLKTNKGTKVQKMIIIR